VRRRQFTALPTLVAIAVTAASAAPASAQGIPKIPFEKYSLANGLEVILHQDRSVPLVAVEMFYKVGSGDERVGRTGFAHLFEHVMFMGSENVPVGAFDQWLEAAGGNNNGTTNTDRTTYFEVVPSNALPLALWLEADRMGRLLPTLDQAKLDLQRDVVKNERRERYDNAPYGRANETISAALYPPGHPYSWPTIGSMADLSAASLEDVRTFFRTYYAPNNASLTIAGDFDRDSVRVWVQRYFGWIPRGPEVPPRATPARVVVPRDTALVLEDRVQLPRVYYTWPTVRLYHPDDAALDILAHILAGDKTSRLYKRLVYEEQVAQNVSAWQTSPRLDGFFKVDVTPRPGRDPSKVMRMVDEEISRLIRDGVDARELARAQNTFRARFLDDLASVLGKAMQLSSYNYFAGTPDYVQEDAARYDRVTAADVQRVARTYVGAPKVILTVVPEGKKDLMVKAETMKVRS
jgi:zinc protease